MALSESDYLKAFGGLFIRLHYSLIEQLTTTPYFPLLNPNFSGEHNDQGYIKKIQSDPIEYASFARCDQEAMKERISGDYEYISLFEMGLWIGYSNDTLFPFSFFLGGEELLATAILDSRLDPREPANGSPLSELLSTKTFVKTDEEHAYTIPDLSWTVSLKEAEKYAISDIPHPSTQNLHII